MKKIIYIIFIAVGISSCSGNDEKADAYGNFEATETIKITKSKSKDGFFSRMDNYSRGQSKYKINITTPYG